MSNGNLEQLAEKIKGLNKPSLSEDKKIELKNFLVSQLEQVETERVGWSFRNLVSRIMTLRDEIKLSSHKRVIIKERILRLIENRSQKRFFWSNFYSVKKFVSFAMVFALLFFSISYLNIDTRVVRAQSFTVLESVKGEVLVERNGEFAKITPEMYLFEGDKIVTGKDGEAVIKYFDDSVSRVAPYSELVINRLVKSSDNAARTYVEVSVVNGTVWSKVVNLVEQNSSFVVEALDVYATAKRAAFNVDVHGQKVEIGVFQHVVDVKDDGSVERVLSGSKVIKDEKEKKLVSLGNNEKSEQWVKKNLQDDDKYLSQVEKRLIAAKMESLGLKPEDEVSFENSLQENTLVFLTFDDVKKEKLKLDLADKDFVAAQVKLYEADLTPEELEETSEAMGKFSKEVEDFYKLIDEVKTTDQAYAKDLTAYVEDKLMIHKKDLSVVDPGKPVYQAKKIVENLELLSAKDEAGKLEIKVEQSSDRLFAAEEAKEKGDFTLANKAVTEYKKEMSSVIQSMNNMNTETAKKQKDLLADKVNENIDLLDAIEVSPKDVISLKTDLQNAIYPNISVMITETETNVTCTNCTKPGTIGTTTTTVPTISVTAPTATSSTSTALTAPTTVTAEPSGSEIEPIQEGPFGVKIKGDKPLDPLLGM